MSEHGALKASAWISVNNGEFTCNLSATSNWIEARLAFMSAFQSLKLITAVSMTLSAADVRFQGLICAALLTQPQDLWSRLQIEWTRDSSVSALTKRFFSVPLFVITFVRRQSRLRLLVSIQHQMKNISEKLQTQPHIRINFWRARIAHISAKVNFLRCSLLYYEESFYSVSDFTLLCTDSVEAWNFFNKGGALMHP